MFFCITEDNKWFLEEFLGGSELMGKESFIVSIPLLCTNRYF